MAAVINLNILNFFKLKEQNSTTNNIRFNAFNLEKRQRDDSTSERVIDITPFNRVINDAEELESDAVPQELIEYRKQGPHHHSYSSGDAYNRKGRTVKYIYPKGLHVDLYV